MQAFQFLNQMNLIYFKLIWYHIIHVNVSLVLKLFLSFFKNGWEKRYSFIRLVVELVTRASHHKETHTLSYTEIIAFLIQTVVDVSVYGRQS